jgi:hypothetical protein
MRVQLYAAAFAAICLASTPSLWTEQKIEYGSKAEMRGAKVVFIDTGTNIDFRENVIGTLRRELPEIEVSDRQDETVDLILQFQIDNEGDGKGEASLLVLGKPKAPESVRILAKYVDSKSSILTPKLSVVLTRRFMRDFRAANRAAPRG